MNDDFRLFMVILKNFYFIKTLIEGNKIYIRLFLLLLDRERWLLRICSCLSGYKLHGYQYFSCNNSIGVFVNLIPGVTGNHVE